MQHAEKRFNVWYAVLTVPAEVRHVIGRVRFFQTTHRTFSNSSKPSIDYQRRHQRRYTCETQSRRPSGGPNPSAARTPREGL